MQHSPNLFVASDDGVQLAAFGQLVEIDGETAQGVELLVAALILHFFTLAQLEDGHSESVFGGAEVTQQLAGGVFALGNAEQHQLDADVFIAVFGQHFLGSGEGFVGRRCEVLFFGAEHLGHFADQGVDALPKHIHRDTAFFEKKSGYVFVGFENATHQMGRVNLLLAKAHGDLLGFHDGILRLEGEIVVSHLTRIWSGGVCVVGCLSWLGIGSLLAAGSCVAPVLDSNLTPL
ncbi:MAG: hypothetical protein KatS3mg030_271 [Saprospiraceae bacterium]|nr:MAG: hypothetical protein KatS3mg030_271 [Saprospiraceae bacterium]